MPTSETVLRRFLWSLLLCGFVTHQSIVAQKTSSNESPSSNSISHKSVVFEVVSIKPVEHPDPNGLIAAQPDPTLDGYRSLPSQSLWSTIMLAYYQSSRSPLSWRRFMLSGGPPWLLKNQYVIDAKVAQADLIIWQQKDPAGAALRGALQEMLQARCNLKLHRAMAERPVQALMIKPGAKLKIKEANPNETLPGDATRISLYGGGIKHIDGSDAEQFYNITMDYVVSFLTAFGSGPPVIDQTGLKKRYDLIIPRRSQLPEDSGSSVAESPWDLESIGLILKPLRAPVETLVIDHIEEPSPN